MKDAEIFDSMFRNALDFLNRALDELDAHPKYALIDFAAAVELVFKARLVLCGAMWVTDEPTDATPERFAQGKLRTVGLGLAKKRIESLTGENIDATAFKEFQNIARHRNRVVHFFHPGLVSTSQREAVAGEMCVAWYYLYRLLTGPWAEHFSSYSEPISEIGARLQFLTRFLDSVFDRVVMSNPKANTYTKCPVCSFQSLDAATGDRYQSEICHVCGYIEPSHKAIQHGEEDFVASCAACGGHQTVLANGFGFKCSECGESFTGCITCEYCSEHWVGHSDPDYGLPEWL
ncbi:hypothetical protein [Halothiobacillus sp.]|jgi:hypothetical protein|uniref:hypothetical protein n=1 Tax=Halothiobacillus sp. TaxID=1891311 RepID=UPI00262041F1|nr:hypothetical protein [Halothiobacillus sp.]